MWIIERPDGGQEFLIEEPHPERDAPFTRSAQADRAPAAEGTEDWDFEAGEWATSAARAAAWVDRRHAHEFGDQAIAKEHAEKAIEARLLLAGVDIEGYVSAEAAATGRPVLELAAEIAGKAQTDITRAVARRVGKLAARQGGKP